MIAFDIETGSKPIDEIMAIMPPFDPSSIKHPGKFNPDDVKLGNMTDQKKIDAKVEECRKKHAIAVKEHAIKLEQGEKGYWDSIIERAALNSLTGEILAIGYKGKETQLHYVGEGVTERNLIKHFWGCMEHFRKSPDKRKMVGYCIESFDIPFIAQRSFVHDIPVPDCVLGQRYLDKCLVDLASVWKCSNYRAEYLKLDTLCRALGIRGKHNGMNGGQFAGMFRNPETQDEALAYLDGDLEMIFALAERLGF